MFVVVHLGAGVPDVLEVAPGEGGVQVVGLSHPAMIGGFGSGLKGTKIPPSLTSFPSKRFS
jgi:hypothetical protein